MNNRTRIESWRFFEPPPGGGDPDYAFFANRLRFGLERARPRYEIAGALQYVQLAALPSAAVGPGPLGTGALYFQHSGRAGVGRLYLRALHLTLCDLRPGLRLRAGRFGYTSGGEAASGDAQVETIKRLRLDSRLIGEFEWSHFERAYDGVRIDWDRRRWQLSLAALRPTQGGFEPDAGAGLEGVRLFTGAASVRPGQLLPRTEAQAFAYRYEDRRPVEGRPDNTGLTAARADVRINSFGVTLAGAYPRQQTGRADAVVWGAAQTGSWYGQPHRAYALAVEAGYQWTDAPGRPWLRAGVLRASGDRDSGDARHGTFFQMLPTGRKYSLTTAYSLMNLQDVFVQVLARPRPALGLRVDLHRLSLVRAADRWYAGSGATRSTGAFFGYAGRPSHGATGLGTAIEGAAEYVVNRHWSVNGYAGLLRGGPVVRGSFAGDRLVFAYVEHVVGF